MSDLHAAMTKLAKVLPRLASDSDGEVLACVRALRNVLVGAGLDFNDLGTILGATDSLMKANAALKQQLADGEAAMLRSRANVALGSVARGGARRAEMPASDVATARGCLATSGLRANEEVFLTDIISRGIELTERQAQWLKAIAARLGVR